MSKGKARAAVAAAPINHHPCRLSKAERGQAKANRGGVAVQRQRCNAFKWPIQASRAEEQGNCQLLTCSLPAHPVFCSSSSAANCVTGRKTRLCSGGAPGSCACAGTAVGSTQRGRQQQLHQDEEGERLGCQERRRLRVAQLQRKLLNAGASDARTQYRGMAKMVSTLLCAPWTAPSISRKSNGSFSPGSCPGLLPSPCPVEGVHPRGQSSAPAPVLLGAGRVGVTMHQQLLGPHTSRRAAGFTPGHMAEGPSAQARTQFLFDREAAEPICALCAKCVPCLLACVL